MEIFTTTDGFLFLMRWFHFLAGVAWIGMLWYFNLVQTPFFGTDLGGEARSSMTRGLVPNALWWFRWGAMFTFLTGLTILLIKWMQLGGLANAYMMKILTGALMGTFMFLNVWLVIWPAQKVVIANAEQVAGGGEAIPEAAARAARAGTASRINTLFSIPMLFFMGAASHLAHLGAGEFSHMLYWVIALPLIVIVEAHALIGPGLATQKPLTSVSGTIHAGLGLTVVLYIVASIA